MRVLLPDPRWNRSVLSPLALEKARSTAAFTSMKRARNPEFKVLWKRIYNHLVGPPHKVDTGEGLCADISARDEFVRKKRG